MPGVPGTRTCRIGARREPVFILKSEPGAGIARREASESLVYAKVRWRRVKMRVVKKKFMVACYLQLQSLVSHDSNSEIQTLMSRQWQSIFKV